MTFEPGQVVTLKSGSQPMTIVAVMDENIDCVWIGEEGDFFRHIVPAVALTAAEADQEDSEDESDDEAETDEDESDESEDESDEEEGSKSKRKVA